VLTSRFDHAPTATHGSVRGAGNVCTSDNGNSGCDGSASFHADGEHLYIWDNFADGHSVVVVYWREDVGTGQRNEAWNHYGAGTRMDRNLDMAKGVGIKYQVCTGEYSTRKTIYCSVTRIRYA
jgi:hypothetical protein